MAHQQTYSHTPADPPDRVTSEPVPVPPPADDADRAPDDIDRDDNRRDAAEDVTDRVPEDALDDRGTFEDPALAGERNDPDDLTAVTPEYHEPAPQQTAFGAATAGGAAAAAAQAGPSREVHDRTADETEGVVDDRDPDAGTDMEAARNGREVHDDLDAGQRHDLDADGRAEEPLGGPTDLPEATPAVDSPAEAVATPAVEEPIAGLWGESTVQGYRDRWREVQLRFIDDPPGAAREANQLVEEAVDAFTAELSREKQSLGGWSGEDTEELRAVVRRHRDFLDRLLAL